MCNDDYAGFRVLVVGITLLVAGLIGMGCLVGFKVNSDANARLVPAMCTPIDYPVVFKPLGCSYQCNCDSQGNCATCYR